VCVRVDVFRELGAGEAVVGDHDLAAVEETLEQFGGDDAFGGVGGCEFEADW
jgi:hypothetical protein